VAGVMGLGERSISNDENESRLEQVVV